MTRLPSLAPVAFSAIVLVLVGCEQRGEHSPNARADAAGVGDVGPASSADDAAPEALSCHPAPITVPTLPDVIPGYLELDPATGLHVTGTYQIIDVASWHLKVTGKVDHPLSLTYDDLRCLPKKTVNATIVCKGYFTDHANFSGVTLAALLDLAGVQTDADTLVIKGADDYSANVPIEPARFEDNLVAYELEGQPLPILHGFPARTLFSNMPGSTSVKWLLEIEAITAE